MESLQEMMDHPVWNDLWSVLALNVAHKVGFCLLHGVWQANSNMNELRLAVAATPR